LLGSGKIAQKLNANKGLKPCFLGDSAGQGGETVKYSRRDLTFLLPALLPAAAESQPATLPSHPYRFEDLPVRANGENRSRAVFDGLTHSGFHLDLHETELAPGMAPHPPHHHEHEEVVIIREGVLEVTIAGQSTRLGPGSVAFLASGDEHGWRNVGTTRAHYYVLALGKAVK
jgi:quercetin dioxygenase-like cupin family protein